MSENNMPNEAVDIRDLLEDEARETPTYPLKIVAGQAVFASIERVRYIVEKHSYLCFVWPDEGEFDEEGNFQFNDEHIEFEPLLVDQNSANVMIIVRDALKEKNQPRFDRKVAMNRDEFIELMESSWSIVSYKSHGK